MPSKGRTWESHTKTGYYLGAAWDHYRCHQVWIEDTKSTRIGQTVFFKHRYMTQPQMTETDALLKVGCDLCKTLRKAPPESKAMERAINALANIFKSKATSSKTVTDKRREQRANARQQKVASEEEEAEAQRVPKEQEAQRVPEETTTPQRVPEEDTESKDDGLRM